MPSCFVPLQDRRRHFWATQSDACGGYKRCDKDCAVAGLELQQQDAGATFSTHDWVKSLLINIFNTYARVDPTLCGTPPGRQGGHWSESYGDGTYIGTHMFDPMQPQASFRDALALLKAKVAKDAYKLVTYGVAQTVDVVTTYLGGNRVSVDITVSSFGSVDGRVNLTAQRLENKWVWEA